jgi:hypothetical protein
MLSFFNRQLSSKNTLKGMTLKVKSKAVCTKLSNATEASVKKLLGKISN